VFIPGYYLQNIYEANIGLPGMGFYYIFYLEKTACCIIFIENKYGAYVVLSFPAF